MSAQIIRLYQYRPKSETEKIKSDRPLFWRRLKMYMGPKATRLAARNKTQKPEQAAHEETQPPQLPVPWTQQSGNVPAIASEPVTTPVPEKPRQ
jgi:hypothetical protein